jgi:general secretion pathway protein G
MAQMFSRHARSGFSLIEIVVAILIVGVMAAAVTGFLAWRKKGEITATKTSLAGIKLAIDHFHEDVSAYPETLKDLISKPYNEELANGWQGPYLDKTDIPKDAWKRPFQYQVTPGAEHEYELSSYGPKGKSAPSAEWISVWKI